MWFVLFGIGKHNLGSCFCCDGLVILSSVPTDCFSEPQLATKTLWFWFGCHVSRPLQSFRTSILNGQEDLKSLLLFIVQYPCYCLLLSFFLPLLKLHKPRGGGWALSSKELVLSTLCDINFMAISILLSFFQLCTMLWYVVKEEFMLKMLLWEEVLLQVEKSYKLWAHGSPLP